MQTIVISQPKAGTYLCANLLQQLNLHFTGMHVRGNNYTQLDLEDLNYSRKNLKELKVRTPLSESVNLISENSFAVSHLEYSTKSEQILSGFKKILLLRDLKTCKASWDAWARIAGKSKESKNLDPNFRNIIEKWKAVEDVFVMDFYDMKSKNIQKINELQMYLFQEVKFDAKKAISTALKTDSLTKVKR